MERVRRSFKFLWDLVESATFALAIFVVAYLFLFRPSVVQGYSSYPTIKPDEKVIAERVSYHFQNPQRGDFVILESPNNPEVDFIKRIVGLPRETIRINYGKVFINGDVLDEPYISSGTFGDREILIPENYYFVMGDNRGHSSDSRDFGPIPRNTIVGKVILRFWPPERFGPLALKR